MSFNYTVIAGLIVGSAVFLFLASKFASQKEAPKGPPMLRLQDDITKIPRTRHNMDVVNHVIEQRTKEIAKVYNLDPKRIFITVNEEPVLNKFDEFYTVTFELGIKGVHGLYAERYTVQTTRKRVFNITKVGYDHKCTIGEVIQEWTITPCAGQ